MGFLEYVNNDESIASLLRYLYTREGDYPKWPTSLDKESGDVNNPHDGYRCLSGDDIFGYAGFLATGCGKRKGTMARDWNSKDGVQMMISPQFKSSIPNAFKQSAGEHGRLMATIWSELGSGHSADDEMELWEKDSGNDISNLAETSSRETFLNIISSVISNATSSVDPETAVSEDNLFLAHKVTCDIEELFHGKASSEEPCFEDEEDHIVLGYGARQCLEIYKTQEEKGGSNSQEVSCADKSCGTGGDTDAKQERIYSKFKKLVSDTRCILSKQDIEQLHSLGLQKDCTGRVVWAINHRQFGAVDVEHMLCKVYLCLDRTRGNRSMCVPMPVNKCSWPTYDPNPKFCGNRSNLRKIFHRMKDSFTSLAQAERIFNIPEVCQLFKLKK